MMSIWLKIGINTASNVPALILSRVLILVVIGNYVGDTKQAMNLRKNLLIQRF